MFSGYKKYKSLVLRLAKTDFKLRYQGSVLGYIWAILKPLIFFAVLNFVFSSVFNFKNTGVEYYTLELLVGVLLFSFFSEGTLAGINSLLSKSQLVTKVFVPRWTIVLASTLNALFVFLMNLFVMVIFFVVYGKIPSLTSLALFILYIILLYMLILGISFLLSPLLVRFRDVRMIWEVLLPVLMYAAPIIYPLSMLPVVYHKFILANPLSFVIYFAKQGLISDHFATVAQTGIFVFVVTLFAGFSFWLFTKTEKRVAEFI